MDQPVTIQPAPTLRGFCQHVIANCSEKWPPDEQYIADLFVKFFDIGPLVSTAQLTRLCTSLGISVSLTKLPAGLRGHNCVFEDKREIVITETIDAAAVMGSREHTLLHELREIIEYEFRHLQRPIATGYEDREERAEDFASDVRLAASFKTFGQILEGLGKPKWTFGEVCFAVITGVAMVVYCITCVMLPHWEDQLPG